MDRASQPMLEAKGITLKDVRGSEALKDVSLTLFPGQIVGVAGISGNGQRELAEAFFGLRTPTQGAIFAQGMDCTGAPPAVFMEHGVAFVSEDPLNESVIPGFTILEHMVMGGLAPVPKGLGIHWDEVRDQVTGFQEGVTLGLAAPERRVDQLSGGNVQRMVLTRALIRSPKALIVSYPSRGLDIGTVRSIHRLLMKLRSEGCAILLLSEDLNELFTLSDQLVVLGNNRLYGPYDPALTDPYHIGYIMVKGESA